VTRVYYSSLWSCLQVVIQSDYLGHFLKILSDQSSNVVIDSVRQWSSNEINVILSTLPTPVARTYSCYNLSGLSSHLHENSLWIAFLIAISNINVFSHLSLHMSKIMVSCSPHISFLWAEYPPSSNELKYL